MKIAVSGKGGVGKTTVSALLARSLAQHGYRVLAVDADPDANLGQALGLPDYQELVPISEMTELIDERTDSQGGAMGTFFKLNPTVSDLPDKLSVEHDGVRLMVMGTVKKGGGGCICPASTMLKALMSHLMLLSKDALILDMEAGLEHLGRGTARGVDFLIVVVEPGRRSVETALTIKGLAQDLGIKRLFIVGNKIREQADRDYLEKALPEFNFLGFLAYDGGIISADLDAVSPAERSPQAAAEAENMVTRLIEILPPA